MFLSAMLVEKSCFGAKTTQRGNCFPSRGRVGLSAFEVSRFFRCFGTGRAEPASPAVSPSVEMRSRRCPQFVRRDEPARSDRIAALRWWPVVISGQKSSLLYYERSGLLAWPGPTVNFSFKNRTAGAKRNKSALSPRRGKECSAVVLFVGQSCCSTRESVLSLFSSELRNA